MAKKTPILTDWQVIWGGGNSVREPTENLVRVAILGNEDEEVVAIEPDGNGGMTVGVGPISISVRKPTPGEKRQGWDCVIEVTQGLDDEYVMLGEKAGASVISDEGSDEAE
jgi:hypothetical protein